MLADQTSCNLSPVANLAQPLCLSRDGLSGHVSAYSRLQYTVTQMQLCALPEAFLT